MKKPEILGSKTVWQGEIETIEALELLLPGGVRQTRLVTKTRPGAVVAAIDDYDRLALIEYYRLPVNDTLIELPAGKIDLEDTPLSGARRELAEEIGLVAKRWKDLGVTYGAQGASNWQCHYFLARELELTTEARELHENHLIHWVELGQCWEWVRSGRICNNYSIVGIVKALSAMDRLPESVSLT